MTMLINFFIVLHFPSSKFIFVATIIVYMPIRNLSIVFIRFYKIFYVFYTKGVRFQNTKVIFLDCIE